MKRMQTDRCLNCGCTRGQATKEGYLCARGYTDESGEFTETNSWPKHSWPKAAR